MSDQPNDRFSRAPTELLTPYREAFNPEPEPANEEPITVDLAPGSPIPEQLDHHSGQSARPGVSLSLPPLVKLRQWRYSYAPETPDDREAIRDFLMYESTESKRGLQAELQRVAQGQYPDATLDTIVGAFRKAKFGTYQGWAKQLLRWIIDER